MELEDDLQELCKIAKQLGASNAVAVNVDNIKNGQWTRIKCQYGCPNYGSNLCCPPYTPDYEKMQKFLSEYSKAVLVEYVLNIYENTEYDFDKIDLNMSNDLLEILLDLEKKAFFKNYYRSFALKAGKCRLCAKCNLKKCLHPTKARPSLEACGIDVFSLASDNGFDMKVLTKPVNEFKIYGLLLVD